MPYDDNFTPQFSTKNCVKFEGKLGPNDFPYGLFLGKDKNGIMKKNVFQPEIKDIVVLKFKGDILSSYLLR